MKYVITLLALFIVLIGCNKETHPLVDNCENIIDKDTVYTDTTLDYGKYTFPEVTHWATDSGIVSIKGGNQSMHPCCVDAWGCTVDPGIPSVAPFYASNVNTETVYRVIWANKPNEDFEGVEVAYLDGNGIYQQGDCDTTFFVDGMVNHSASCDINPPFTCP